ncbi:unnamed protein product [Amoebophrya sp. A25]|nr:unnamed protein product [Amoebophrya sp. A25]|eukprot:GSA25T00015731001.1
MRASALQRIEDEVIPAAQLLSPKSARAKQADDLAGVVDSAITTFQDKTQTGQIDEALAALGVSTGQGALPDTGILLGDTATGVNALGEVGATLEQIASGADETDMVKDTILDPSSKQASLGEEMRFSPEELADQFCSSLAIMDTIETQEKMADDLVLRRAQAYEQQSDLVGTVAMQQTMIQEHQTGQENIMRDFLDVAEKTRQHHLQELTEEIRIAQEQTAQNAMEQQTVQTALEQERGELMEKQQRLEETENQRRDDWEKEKKQWEQEKEAWKKERQETMEKWAMDTEQLKKQLSEQAAAASNIWGTVSTPNAASQSAGAGTGSKRSSKGGLLISDEDLGESPLNLCSPNEALSSERLKLVMKHSKHKKMIKQIIPSMPASEFTSSHDGHPKLLAGDLLVDGHSRPNSSRSMLSSSSTGANLESLENDNFSKFISVLSAKLDEEAESRRRIEDELYDIQKSALEQRVKAKLKELKAVKHLRSPRWVEKKMKSIRVQAESLQKDIEKQREESQQIHAQRKMQFSDIEKQMQQLSQSSIRVPKAGRLVGAPGGAHQLLPGAGGHVLGSPTGAVGLSSSVTGLTGAEAGAPVFAGETSSSTSSSKASVVAAPARVAEQSSTNRASAGKTVSGRAVGLMGKLNLDFMDKSQSSSSSHEVSSSEDSAKLKSVVARANEDIAEHKLEEQEAKQAADLLDRALGGLSASPLSTPPNFSSEEIAQASDKDKSAEEKSAKVLEPPALAEKAVDKASSRAEESEIAEEIYSDEFTASDDNKSSVGSLGDAMKKSKASLAPAGKDEQEEVYSGVAVVASPVVKESSTSPPLEIIVGVDTEDETSKKEIGTTTPPEKKKTSDVPILQPLESSERGGSPVSGLVPSEHLSSVLDEAEDVELQYNVVTRATGAGSSPDIELTAKKEVKLKSPSSSEKSSDMKNKVQEDNAGSTLFGSKQRSPSPVASLSSPVDQEAEVAPSSPQEVGDPFKTDFASKSSTGLEFAPAQPLPVSSANATSSAASGTSDVKSSELGKVAPSDVFFGPGARSRQASPVSEDEFSIKDLDVSAGYDLEVNADLWVEVDSPIKSVLGESVEQVDALVRSRSSSSSKKHLTGLDAGNVVPEAVVVDDVIVASVLPEASMGLDGEGIEPQIDAVERPPASLGKPFGKKTEELQVVMEDDVQQIGMDVHQPVPSRETRTLREMLGLTGESSSSNEDGTKGEDERIDRAAGELVLKPRGSALEPADHDDSHSLVEPSKRTEEDDVEIKPPPISPTQRSQELQEHVENRVAACVDDIVCDLCEQVWSEVEHDRSAVTPQQLQSEYGINVACGSGSSPYFGGMSSLQLRDAVLSDFGKGATTSSMMIAADPVSLRTSTGTGSYPHQDDGELPQTGNLEQYRTRNGKMFKKGEVRSMVCDFMDLIRRVVEDLLVEQGREIDTEEAEGPSVALLNGAAGRETATAPTGATKKSDPLWRRMPNDFFTLFTSNSALYQRLMTFCTKMKEENSPAFDVSHLEKYLDLLVDALYELLQDKEFVQARLLDAVPSDRWKTGLGVSPIYTLKMRNAGDDKNRPTYRQIAGLLGDECLKYIKPKKLVEGMADTPEDPEALIEASFPMSEEQLDALLGVELRDEEKAWLKVDEELLEVKNQLADSILDTLLGETVFDLVNLFQGPEDLLHPYVDAPAADSLSISRLNIQ